MTSAPDNATATAYVVDETALRALVHDAVDGIMVVDQTGTICFANPAAEAIFAVRGRLVGEPFGIPLVAADKTELDVPLGDGSVGVFELRVSPTSWPAGDTPAHLITLRDITDRARTQAEIAALNEQLRVRAQAAEVLDQVGDGVLLVDSQGTVQLINPAARRLLGLGRHADVGSSIHELVSDWAQVERVVDAMPSDFDGRPRGQSVVLEIAGEELWLSVTCAIVEHGTVYAFHDLTDEVRVDRMKNDFVATTSHELRTPLTSIFGAAHTLQQMNGRLDDQTSRQLVDVICTQTRRLRQITDDILAARSLELGQQHVGHERLDAGELAHEVVDAAAVTAPVGIDVVCEGPDGDGPLWALADPGKLRQVLTNLVQNAVKYSPEGGTVRVRVLAREACVQFEVHDNGLGIARADHDLIFKKFYRSGNGKPHAVGGTGLGLYIARELVRRMDGHLWLDSQPGEGSVFYVRVPSADSVD